MRTNKVSIGDDGEQVGDRTEVYTAKTQQFNQTKKKRYRLCSAVSVWMEILKILMWMHVFTHFHDQAAQCLHSSSC